MQRVHILSTVNAGAVSKAGDTYTIAGVCGCVDDLVMNGVLYPAQELAAGVPSLEGKPAPAGHPKDAQGRYISATNGAALASAWIGSYCTNARHEDGRTLVDVVVNGKQARAHEDGAKLVERLETAINGKNAEPIHVSTGLVMRAVNATGESRGKKYARVATGINYDHLAILLNEPGAGTPSDGVGMFLNAAGQEQAVEAGRMDGDALTPDALPDPSGERGWPYRMLLRLFGHRIANAAGHMTTAEETAIQLGYLLPVGATLREFHANKVVWADASGHLWEQAYTANGASVAFSGTPTKVAGVDHLANQGSDTVKETIVAALTTAGINTAGMTDADMLAGFQALAVKPVQAKLDATNSKLAEFEAAANAAKDAELSALATELAANSALTVDDLKRLGVDRLKELKAKAAPVVVNTKAPADKYAGYSINDAGKAA